MRGLLPVSGMSPQGLESPMVWWVVLGLWAALAFGVVLAWLIVWRRS